MTWTDNVLRVGGVTCEITTFNDHYMIRTHINPMPKCAYQTEAEARAAAEEIVRQIFGSEEIRLIENCEGLQAYVKMETEIPQCSTWRTKQRGVFVPLED